MYNATKSLFAILYLFEWPVCQIITFLQDKYITVVQRKLSIFRQIKEEPKLLARMQWT